MSNGSWGSGKGSVSFALSFYANAQKYCFDLEDFLNVYFFCVNRVEGLKVVSGND